MQRAAPESVEQVLSHQWPTQPGYQSGCQAQVRRGASLVLRTRATQRVRELVQETGSSTNQSSCSQNTDINKEKGAPMKLGLSV